MLTREELNIHFEEVWVHFIEYWNRTFIYAAEEHRIWIYINASAVDDKQCYLPPSQKISAFLCISKVYVDAELIYDSNPGQI